MESYGKIDELGEEAPSQDDNELGNVGGMGGGNDAKWVSTDSEPYRVQMARYMQSWSHLIMSRDTTMLRGVHWRVRCALVFLVGLSLTSFVVTDFVLFNDVLAPPPQPCTAPTCDRG